MILNDTPIVIYDTAAKTKVGIFRTPTLVFRYLFPTGVKTVSKTTIYNRLHSKKVFKAPNLDCAITLRYANKEQQALLNEEEYLIFEGYDNPLLCQMKGYTSDWRSLQKESAEKCNRYHQLATPEEKLAVYEKRFKTKAFIQ